MSIIVQLLINLISAASIILIVSLSFNMTYLLSKSFNISHAALITLGAYFSFLFSVQANFPLSISIILAVILTSIFGAIIELFFLKPIRDKTDHALVVLIASLGLYVILENAVSLIWGTSTLSIRTREIRVGYLFMNARITAIQIFSIAVSSLVIILYFVFYRFSDLGKRIRAMSSNKVLANVFGINSKRVIIWTYSIASGMAGFAGVLIALDIDMRPTMGFSYLLYGVVVMIIGGVGSTWGLIGGAFFLATAQHFGAYYIDSKWMDAIAYIILILFLIWKPLGFGGQRLKKVDI